MVIGRKMCYTLIEKGEATMENINKVNEVKGRFWQKVMIAFCLLTILFSLLSISSSFARGLNLKNNSKSNSEKVFSSTYKNERVRVAFPEGENPYLSHNLGVDLGVEKAIM